MILIFTLFTLSLFANVESKYPTWKTDCRSIYESIIFQKQLDKDNIFDAGYYGAFFLGPLAYATPITAAILAAPTAGALIYGSIASREQRAMSLADDTSKRFSRLVKRAQRRIDEGITEEEVLEVVESGFDNGVYCRRLPKTYNFRQIRSYTLERLEKKYLN